MKGFSAALLVGGKSSRMGRDKCLIEIDGQPLWRRQSALLREIADEVFVAAPVRPSWCPEDLPWLADTVTGHGPLAGLAAALRAAHHPHVVLLAVDLPCMTSTYLDSLKMETGEGVGAVPEKDGFFQPLSAIYPRAALASICACLDGPDQSFQTLLRSLVARGLMRSRVASVCEYPLFRNLNTPND